LAHVAQVFVPISGSNIGSHLAQIFVDIHTLTEIHARCMVKKVRFDLETLLCDIFPSK